MKLYILRFVLAFAWTVNDYSNGFVDWAEKCYMNEVYGLRRFE